MNQLNGALRRVSTIHPKPKKKEATMYHVYKYLMATLVAVFALMLMPSTAWAGKDPKCLARCKLKDQAAQPACMAACPEAGQVTPPPVEMKTCWDGSKVPKTSKCPDKPVEPPVCKDNEVLKNGKCVPKGKQCKKGEVLKNGKCVPRNPGDPECKEHEEIKDGHCVCTEDYERWPDDKAECTEKCGDNEKRNENGCCICEPNFDRISAKENACMPLCKDGEVRNTDGDCVAETPAPVTPPSDGGFPWWLIILMGATIVGLAIWLILVWRSKRNREKADALVAEGDKLLNRRKPRYEAALAKYNEALKLVPDHERALAQKKLCDKALEDEEEDEEEPPKPAPKPAKGKGKPKKEPEPEPEPEGEDEDEEPESEPEPEGDEDAPPPRKTGGKSGKKDGPRKVVPPLPRDDEDEEEEDE